MIEISFDTLVKVTGGRLKTTDDNEVETVNALVTDSREIERKEEQRIAFLALKGPNFDGHRFVEQVVTQGCVLIIVDHQITELHNTVQLIVDDTRQALGKIAAHVKTMVAPKTVGITGSSGKTTVKEMVAAILSQLGNVLATQGNFNNDIGVPLTLLRLDHSHDFAVIEMGANHIGEIAYTAGLTQPDVAVINNIAAAHLEGFGDLCGVARAKGEIFSGLGEHGVALYNQDTPFTDKWQWRLTNKRVRTFSCVNKATCYSSDILLNEGGCASFVLNTTTANVEITLNVPGKHNVCNAVAAAAIALEFGASLEEISQGLAKMQAVKGRLNLYQFYDKKSACNIRLIDDSYNANLDSTKAAAELLSTYPGRTILILGDMGELGSEARRYHQEVGDFAKYLQLNTLISLGVLSQNASDAFVKNNTSNEKSQHFNQRTMLMPYLFNLLSDELQSSQNDIAILVKGSRSAHMENVVTELMAWFKEMTIQPVTGTFKQASANQNKKGQV
jgi:UDP-N-acetylmuramoyl-tripeptide--D-alanyl-D-alanine ligase